MKSTIQLQTMNVCVKNQILYTYLFTNSCRFTEKKTEG